MILLGMVTPTQFYFPYEFVTSMLDMVSFSYAHKVVTGFNFVYKCSPKTQQNRNEIIREREKGDYVLMVDSDMVVPPNLLSLLLETSSQHPDAVITGMGVIGRPPWKPSIFLKTNDKKKMRVPDTIPLEPFEIDACGSFCLLIPVHILDKVGDHCFDHIHDYFPEEKNQERQELRHDLAFCLRVKEAGFQIFCDPRASIGHLRPSVATIADWNGSC